MGLLVCVMLIICFLSTTVLAAFPYIDLVPGSEKLEGRYIGSTICYRASVAGTLGEGGGGFTSYLQSRVCQALTLIKSSSKVQMWGTPYYATILWCERSGADIKGKAYGYYKYQDSP